MSSRPPLPGETASPPPAADRYRALLDAIDEGFCVIQVLFDGSVAADYRFVEVNAAFERQTGLRDVAGRRMRELAPAHEGHWFEVYGRVATTGRPVRFESRAEQLGRWFDVYAFPVDHGHDRRVGVLFRDVTDRKRADEAIRASEARFRHFADTAPAVLWVTEPDGSCSFLSRGWYEFTGQTEATGLGFGWLDVVHPDDQAAARDAFLAANAQHEPFELEHRLRRADGVYRWALDAARPRFGPSGEFLGYVGSVIDIDDRKRAEGQLREQERLLRETAEVAHVGGWSFDPDTLEADWTAETARIHGLAPDARPSVADAFLRFPPGERERIQAALLAAQEHGTPHDLELNFTAADGVKKRVRAVCRPVVEGGKVVRVRGSLQDVTERHRLEEKLRQSQKMDAFGQLAGGVAHDFNNMLQVINGYAELLADGLPVGDPRAALVAEVRKAGERSAALTRQLLAFARRQVAAPRVIDPSSAAADTSGMLRRLIGEDVRLVTDLPPGVWPVFADPGQVEQVLLNLAVNARDAMPGGGTLTVATRNEDVPPAAAAEHSDAKAGPHAVLSATDTGTGMTPEVMARAFEPFFTTKGVGQGTGLGLATVYGIVRQAGGHLRVRSQVGVGSTFEVFLPRAEQAAEGPVPSTPAALPRGTETVLVVEDETAVRGLVRMVLSGCGYTVLEGADGAAAERVAAEHAGPIHLVLSDVVMPGAGGRLAAAGILARHPEARVVFMSGYTDDAVMRQGVRVADVPFLQKPFTPAVLAAKVRQVLDDPR